LLEAEAMASAEPEPEQGGQKNVAQIERDADALADALGD